MELQKEIMWDNAKWIINYDTIEMKEIRKYPNGETLCWKVPCKIFKDVVYFYINTKSCYYKILGEEVIEIEKEEWEKIPAERKRNDPQVFASIYNFVTLLILTDVIRKKTNLKVSIPKQIQQIIRNNFSRKFTPEISGQIQRISRIMLASLGPFQLYGEHMRKPVKEIYEEMSKEDEEFFSAFIDMIYQNDKEQFDHLCENIIKARNSRKR